MPSAPVGQPRDAAPREIRAFNTLRGVAALSVAVFHAPMLFGLRQVFPHAYLAVDLFFVLSGFVMAHVYGPRIAGGMGFARYAQLRLARLYPLLVIATAGGLAFWVLRVALHRTAFSFEALPAVPLNLLLIPVNGTAIVGQPAAYPFVTQSWSITWELALCALFFAWRAWLGRGAVVIAAAGAVLLALTVVMRGGIDGGWSYDSVWVGGVRALFAFWAGVAAQGWIARRGERPAPAWMTWAALGGALVVLLYAGLVTTTLWPVELAASTVVFPLMVLTAAGSRSRLLANPVGDALGDASYSIYLLHGVSLEFMAVVLKAVHVPAGLTALVGAAWLLALVPGCWLCWRYVETPLRRRFSDPDLVASPLRRRLRRLGLEPAR